MHNRNIDVFNEILLFLILILDSFQANLSFHTFFNPFNKDKNICVKNYYQGYVHLESGVLLGKMLLVMIVKDNKNIFLF